MRFSLILLLIYLSCGMNSLKHNQSNQLPENTVFLYEKVFLDSGNYGGNFRFCFTDSGQYYYQKNEQLEPKGTDYWDADFPDQVKIQLDEKFISTFNQRVEELFDTKFKKEYGSESTELEKWTFFKGPDTFSVLVWANERPSSLQKFKDELDSFILQSKE